MSGNTTLREMLGLLKINNRLYITNECNEGLLTLIQVEDNVLPLEKALSDDLLDRRVINCGVYDAIIEVQVEGVDDAV